MTPKKLRALGVSAARLHKQYLKKADQFAEALRLLAEKELPAPWKWRTRVGWFGRENPTIQIEPTDVMTSSRDETEKWFVRLRTFLQKYEIPGLHLHGSFNVGGIEQIVGPIFNALPVTTEKTVGLGLEHLA